MEPRYIELTQRYRLYAVASYQEMATLHAQLKHVVLANDFRKLKPVDVALYVECVGSPGKYRNYLEVNLHHKPKSNPLSSLITALLVLYRLNGHYSPYILIASL